tara:strand:- start:587 stop:1273 length:687 start_codon:yes stop_codon:yes gene_type:complete
MTTKMRIWDSLCKTNPDYTRSVPSSYGKKITSIDPMYQIQCMTETFGPVGLGWKYNVKYTYQDSLVFAEVSIHYCVHDNWFEYGPVCSVQNLFKKNGNLDDEAPKKAMTDAMTKAFSHLGMSADVFLGKFDDSKYVQEVKKEFSKPQAKAFPKTNGKKNIKLDMEELDMGRIKNDIQVIDDIYALRKWRKANSDLFDSNNKSLREYRQLTDLYETHETKLNQGVITNG